MFYKKSVFKKETLAQLFFCEFCEIFRNFFLTEQLWVTASACSTNNDLDKSVV